VTTEEIYQQIITQLEASLGQSLQILPRSFIRVLARTLAAVTVTLYKYGNWSLLQQFVARASNDPTTVLGRTIRPLTEWGRLIGAGDPDPATPAELRVAVFVEQQGGTLPAGAQLRSPVTGAVYTTRAGVVLDDGFKTVEVRAVERGTAGNLEENAPLQFVNPLTGVEPVATVTGVVSTGADAEPPEDYRQRVIDRFQRRPQGGAYADYAGWGGGVEGVRRVYPYTGEPGEVDVYVESATEADRVPTQAQLDAVADAIELDDSGLASRRPANAFVNTLPVEVLQFAVTVSGLDVDDEAATQTEIDNALGAFFLSLQPFIVGLSPLPRRDRVTASTVASLVEQIAADQGGIVSGVSVSLDGSPFGLYILGEGELAALQGVTYA